MPSADDVPALPPRWLHGARAAPDGSHVRHEAGRRVRRPALPLRHRHGYAAVLHRGLPGLSHRRGEFPAARRQRVRTAPSPYPPGSSWWVVKGRQTLISRVHLPVSLTRHAPSGSAGTSRRCQGCSHPPRRLPDQAALSFTRPLRRPGGEGLSPPPGFERLVAHMILRPVIAGKQHTSLPDPSPQSTAAAGGEHQRPNGSVLTPGGQARHPFSGTALLTASEGTVCQGLDSPPRLRECSLTGRHRIRVCRVAGPVAPIRSPGSRPARRAVALAMRSSLEAGGAAPYPRAARPPAWGARQRVLLKGERRRKPASFL